MKKTLLTFGLLLITILTFGQQTKYVDTEELNIRAGAGTKYEVVNKISQGQKVTVLTEHGKWSEIELENGTKGFVSTKFLSDSQTSSSSKGSDKKNSWIGYVLVIGFVLYGLKKLFGGSSSSSSSSTRREPRTETIRQTSSKPKTNPLRWYHCKNCNIKIEAGKQPTSLNCSKETFHKWTDLGEVGNQAYSCKNCGTTVYTTKQPTSLNCSRDTFHKWTKLS
jgi:uncharacterized protein YgiM (DUF1202 family)